MKTKFKKSNVNIDDSEKMIERILELITDEEEAKKVALRLRSRILSSQKRDQELPKCDIQLTKLKEALIVD